MRAFIKVIFSILLTLSIILSIGFLLPSTVNIQRSIVINADPKEIHVFINDLKRWPDWVPWNEEADPTIIYTFSEKEEGKDANFRWKGKKFGRGSLTLRKTDPYAGVWYFIAFDKNSMVFEGSINYEPLLAGTLVTWSDKFQLGNNPIRRYFGLILDTMLGADFDKGLEKLKQKVEAK